MTHDIRHLTDYLKRIGIGGIAHTESTYLAHLVSVFRDLERWGCDEEVCRGGMFHSIYGTQQFQGFKLTLERRDEVRGLIGQRAEWLAFLNCFMDRVSFDSAAEQTAGPYKIRNRETGELLDVVPADFEDLCRVHLCDWLEQVPRCKKWNYRRAAYRHLADRLGGAVLESYERVFTQETAEAAARPDNS